MVDWVIYGLFVELKVGTAVVTRSDGRLALGRLGALCEQVIFAVLLFENVNYYVKILFNLFFCLFILQIKELNAQGYEVILVTSGAVGLGRQRLRYRKLVNSRFLFVSD